VTRRVRWFLLGCLAAALLAAGIVAGPRILRALPGFEIRDVEVAGALLLTPGEVVLAAGIVAGESLWNDRAAWERALEAHPVIESARITRKLPGTLRVQIEEKKAVAYVANGALALVTASGEHLPIDPTRARVDLPIARGLEGSDPSPEALAEAGRLALVDPALISEVSEIQATDTAGRVLRLRHRSADILIPTGASAHRLNELRAVMADLDRRLGSGDVREVARLDLRFADQIVVRLPSSVEIP